MLPLEVALGGLVSGLGAAAGLIGLVLYYRISIGILDWFIWCFDHFCGLYSRGGGWSELLTVIAYGVNYLVTACLAVFVLGAVGWQLMKSFIHGDVPKTSETVGAAAAAVIACWLGHYFSALVLGGEDPDKLWFFLDSESFWFFPFWIAALISLWGGISVAQSDIGDGAEEGKEGKDTQK
jgi:hypothetical protein